jgi:Protein of unknown function (DUF2946)
MGKRTLFQRCSYVTALLAVALLSLASPQSIVMQAAQAAPSAAMVVCASMAMGQPNAKHGVPTENTHKNCPFCAAAAHAPLCASVAPIPRSAAVAWTAYRAPRPFGPRGPPAFAPHARGPPQAEPTI